MEENHRLLNMVRYNPKKIAEGLHNILNLQGGANDSIIQIHPIYFGGFKELGHLSLPSEANDF